MIQEQKKKMKPQTMKEFKISNWESFIEKPKIGTLGYYPQEPKQVESWRKLAVAYDTRGSVGNRNLQNGINENDQLATQYMKVENFES